MPVGLVAGRKAPRASMVSELSTTAAVKASLECSSAQRWLAILVRTVRRTETICVLPGLARSAGRTSRKRAMRSLTNRFKGQSSKTKDYC